MTEYMPIPNRNATRLFVHTAGTRIIFMSMSGWRDRDSTTIHATTMTTANAISPITLLEAQPHEGASLTPTRRATNHPDSRTAPHQLIFPGVRTGDSGTNSRAHDRGDDRDDERDPEQPVVVEMFDDRPGQDDPRPSADRGHGGDDAHPGGHLGGGELVPDDAERQGEDGSADSLARHGPGSEARSTGTGRR